MRTPAQMGLSTHSDQPFSIMDSRSMSTEAIRGLREKHFGKGTSLNYESATSAPLHIVAGEGTFLIDSQGNRHLDCVNNVAVLGHAHKKVSHSSHRAPDFTLSAHCSPSLGTQPTLTPADNVQGAKQRSARQSEGQRRAGRRRAGSHVIDAAYFCACFCAGGASCVQPALYTQHQQPLPSRGPGRVHARAAGHVPKAPAGRMLSFANPSRAVCCTLCQCRGQAVALPRCTLRVCVRDHRWCTWSTAAAKQTTWHYASRTEPDPGLHTWW